MELTLKGIEKKAEWEALNIRLPNYDIEKVAADTIENPIWLHFGAGNIFRIFVGGIVNTLLNMGESQKGITCVETFDFDIIDKIYTPYDNLVLAVTLKADGSTEQNVIGSLTEARKAQTQVASEWERLKVIFRNPSLQMISFTITEKGYALKNSDGAFFPLIQSDIEKGPEYCNSAMAVVTALLHERYRANKTPLAVVSLDNCSHNGEKLKNSILMLAEEWLKNRYVPQGFIDYISDEKQVAFPWTMIDKITPRPSKVIAEELEYKGIEHMTPIITSKNTYIAPFVNAEGPQYLVIEDHFPNGRLPLEKAGVYMTDRDTVNQVERMKVTTCLNPLHTGLAVYGCLLGYTKIADEMKDEELLKLVHQIGPMEGMPVVVNPGILSPKEFVAEVIEDRLPNPFMPDAPQRIAVDTSQKVAIRYGETIKSYVTQYGTAERLTAIPLVLAGWCRYLLAIDDKGDAFDLSPDPMLTELTGKLYGIIPGHPETYHGQLKEILSNSNLFGVNLYEAGLGKKVEAMFVEELAGAGAVRAVLKKYL